MTYVYPFVKADEALKSAVWQKGRPIDGYDSREWRRDICGHAMRYQDHGDTSSDHGWEIDHIRPTSDNGSDELDNFQPLFWENNRRKGDSYPWSC